MINTQRIRWSAPVPLGHFLMQQRGHVCPRVHLSFLIAAHALATVLVTTQPHAPPVRAVSSRWPTVAVGVGSLNVPPASLDALPARALPPIVVPVVQVSPK